MLVRTIAISKLKPAAYNPRQSLQPGDPDFSKLEVSLSEFGLVEPLVWNRRTGNLVGGHQRLAVLRHQGIKSVDVSVVDLPLLKEKALNIALNKIQGAWDEHKLAALLDELLRDGNAALTGFEQDEVDALLAQYANANQGAAGDDAEFDTEAELAKIGTPVTKPGDLIVLGNNPRLSHVLLCGDSTDPLHVKRLIEASGGMKATLFATDPPYLVGYDGTHHPAAKGTPAAKKNRSWKTTYGVTWDDAAANPELYEKFCAAAVAEAIRPDAAWYCWHASRRQGMVEAAWNSVGAFVHCQIVWAKNRSILTRTWYSWQHEPCFFGWLKPPLGKKPPKNPDAPALSTVWQIDTIPNGDERPDHPTPKPLGVFERPMLQHTRPGELCYEPFAGSGTQIIVAQQLGRRCAAIEISPVYCDLIVRRWIHSVGRANAPRQLVSRYLKTTGSKAPK
ncbi:MAG: DNA modification methylase [Phycisphaeraceae bacterium]|nr:DNA modification methylase [Phycisphaeraceae bacterium]